MCSFIFNRSKCDKKYPHIFSNINLFYYITLLYAVSQYQIYYYKTLPVRGYKYINPAI